MKYLYLQLEFKTTNTSIIRAKKKIEMINVLTDIKLLISVSSAGIRKCTHIQTTIEVNYFDEHFF